MSGRRRRREQRVTRWVRKQWTRPDAQESASREGEARDGKRSAGRWWKLAFLAAVVVAIPVVAISACLVLSRSGEPSEPAKAAIVDQLSLTFPNPAFVEEATNTLERAGYVVDYFPGEEVTVGLYRALPIGGYDLVVLRVHTAQLDNVWRGKAYDEPVLFTSEPYNPTLYIPEQRELHLNPARTYEGAPRYFAITANFVELSMSGNLDDATVIMMGCGGLSTDRTAEAFIQRGAKRVVGWSGLVSADHTDAATERLLEHLFIEELPVDQAVAITMTEAGPDPVYDSVLLSYPPNG